VRAKKGPAPTKGAVAESGVGGRAQFSPDSKFYIFTISPERGDPAKPPAEAPKPSLGIMELSGGKVTVLTGVRSFQMSENPGRGVVCSTQGKEPDDAGVYAFAPSDKPGALLKLPLAAGKGKYSQFTWSEEAQRYLAFFTDRAASAKDPPNVALYLWDRDAPVK